ncbi:MAG: carboxymuconolactone decarboxylase family protein, partial [Tepidiformaceae bacterium]
SHHIKLGRDFGVSDDDIRAIAEETAGRPTQLEPLARAVLAAARQMTTNLAIEDDTFAELNAALSSELVLDLVMTISFYNGVVRLLGAVEMDVEPEYRHYLEEFPLPPG